MRQPAAARADGPIPATAGIGLRSPHARELLESRPAVGWLEAHSENYFAEGGADVALLEALRQDYPLSLHGVGLSLGSVDPLDAKHLHNLRRIVRRFEPALVSEHVCWGSVDGMHFNDLLPMPRTEEALRHLADRVSAVQELLGREILLENVSSYLEYAHSTIDEPEFLAALASRSGCGLLLDVNNVYVNARNHGFDALGYLDRIPPRAVREIHLAGHAVNEFDGRSILIDTHGTQVCDEVWSLYRHAVRRFPGVPALIEWDTDLPALDVLVGEAHKADAVREQAHAIAA